MIEFDVTRERDKQLLGAHPFPYAIKLHLELDRECTFLSEEDMNILKKYGKVEEWLSRDVVIPGNMTLHAMHFMINRLFGWTNSHLHAFTPYPEDAVKMVEEDNFLEWVELCGLYFRFPLDDVEDLYYDDDFDEFHDKLRDWLQEKYTAPFTYGGVSEFYGQCQRWANEMVQELPVVKVRRSFYEWNEETERLRKETGDKTANASFIKRTAPIEDVTVAEMTASIGMDMAFTTLLERLPLYDVMLMPEEAQDYEKWYADNEVIFGDIAEKAMYMMPPTKPILKKMRYEYDFGAGWAVTITVTDCYQTKADFEATGYNKRALEGGRPLCVAADGLSVIDNGGMDEYIETLINIHDEDEDEAAYYKAMAKEMGWSARRSKPERIL